MGAQQREYRQRIRSVTATQKITKAMELIAASRVIKARRRVEETTPYAQALTQAVAAVAGNSGEEHPLTTPSESPQRIGMLVISSDRGLAGAYPANPLKYSERLSEHLRRNGAEVVPYLVGRKAEGYFSFRERSSAESWTGFSEAPAVEQAREISERLSSDFLTDTEAGGLDEIHVVYTRFLTMVTQEVTAVRMLPLEVVKGESDQGSQELPPEYDFEPDAETVLNALLPQYLTSRLYNMLLQSAASELAARQRAMKSASDNAEDLKKDYTRLANQARQAEITQEISEIVGGAAALADAQ